MKLIFNNLPVLALVVFFSCSNNNGEKLKDQRLAETESATSNNDQQPNGIVGEWDQQYTCFDKNGNYKLDLEEKKVSGTRLGFDWFQFNADGSCLRDKEVKFKSTYEIQNKGNNKELIIHNVHGYTIIELTNEELILGADGAFIVFKKSNNF